MDVYVVPVSVFQVLRGAADSATHTIHVVQDALDENDVPSAMNNAAHTGERIERVHVMLDYVEQHCHRVMPASSRFSTGKVLLWVGCGWFVWSVWRSKLEPTPRVEGKNDNADLPGEEEIEPIEIQDVPQNLGSTTQNGQVNQDFTMEAPVENEHEGFLNGLGLRPELVVEKAQGLIIQYGVRNVLSLAVSGTGATYIVMCTQAYVKGPQSRAEILYNTAVHETEYTPMSWDAPFAF